MSTNNWREALTAEWHRRQAPPRTGPLLPLVAQMFDEAEVLAMADVLLSGRITMGQHVREFEEAFAARVGARYAVMVNSGSSANLLALAVAANPARHEHLRPDDEVLVPAVCWSTSVWPIVQLGLKPVFVDVDPTTLNMDLDDLVRRVTPRTRAVLAVHVLGNSTPMAALLDMVRSLKLLLIEDTCESLGSTTALTSGDARRYLGTLGVMGTYSFYYSHHMTTGEGGMVVADTVEDVDLLRCLRAHGWVRELSNRAALEAQHLELDARFLFVNTAYNLRPMEVQGAMGKVQLGRLEQLNRARADNRQRLVAALTTHAKWREQLEFPAAAPGTEPAWFGFPALLGPRYARERAAYLDYLSSQGVENRPIISGNFTRQPGLARVGVFCDPRQYPGAEQVGDRGFFIGLHGISMSDETIGRVADVLLGYRLV